MEWNFKVVSGNRCPRQFEYHPSKQGDDCRCRTSTINIL